MVKKKELNTSPCFSIWTMNDGNKNLAEPTALWHVPIIYLKSSYLISFFNILSFNFSAEPLVYVFGGKRIRLLVTGRILFIRKFTIYNRDNIFLFLIFLHYIYLVPLCTPQCLCAPSLLLKPLFKYLHT